MFDESILLVENDESLSLPKVGLWRSWERASMAWKRSSVRSRPGPPNYPLQIKQIPEAEHSLLFMTVDAGKPFGQLQEAGMKRAQLVQIMRQKDPEYLKAVEHLSNNETAIGVEMLSQQGRITEIVDPEERIADIAKSYAERPENTLIVSPDNASRRAINQAVRQELQALGVVDKTDHSMRVLTPRNDMTGADREWAGRYEPGDVLHYTRGSKEHGIESQKLCPGRSHGPEREPCYRAEAGRPASDL